MNGSHTPRDDGPAESFTRKRVLVVGASGFIGSHIVDQLACRGANVIGVSRRPAESANASRRWTWERCDASDAATVDEIFARHEPDVVFHLTSDSRNKRDIDVVRPSVMSDVVATVNTLVAAARNGCERVIMAASLDEPLGQAETATPVSPYAAAKYASGCYARMFAEVFEVPVVMLRPMMGYGPRQSKAKLIPHTILSILRGQPVAIHNPERLASWVFVDDLVEAFVMAVTTSDDAIGQTYDLGSPLMITNGDLVMRIARQMNREDLVRLGAGESRTSEVIRQADIRRTADEFGWSARTGLDEGLRRTISWFSGHREGSGPGVG
jgi:nucleoside-diphosphate-sugar epimerase